MALDIAEERAQDVVVLIPTGRLDTNTAKAFDVRLNALITEDQGAVVIDMQGVDYISSFGLRAILSGAKKLAAQRRRFVLCSLQSDVLNVFQISGFIKIISVVDNRPAALEQTAG